MSSVRSRCQSRVVTAHTDTRHAPRPAAESACQHAGSHDAILEAEHESAIEQRRPAAPRGATPPNALRDDSKAASDDGKAASDDGGGEILFGSFTSGGSTTSTAMTDANSAPVHATDDHTRHTPPTEDEHTPLLWDE